MPLPSAVAPADMLRQALAQVMRAAQNGDLPLFAWTLGLPHPERLAVAHFCLPHPDIMPAMPQPQYALLLKQTPPLFGALVRHLQARRNACADARHTLWLTHALAAACWGHRHLWQDLGLCGCGDMQQLLAHYLPQLLQHNGRSMSCKRFLFESLGLALQQPALQAPGCHAHAGCYPAPRSVSLHSAYDGGMGKPLSAPATPAIQLQGSLDMLVDGHKFGGSPQVALLEAIAKAGSITQAAKAIGLSYKAAWDAVDAMNQMAGEPLVQRATGGKGGGGTRLTPRGQRLVDNFRQIETEHQRFVAVLAAQAGGLADDYVLLRRLTMQTSARNQFAGTVKAVQHGAVNDEVILAIGGQGREIVAIVTHESLQTLGLKPGAQAVALIKSSAIVLVTDMAGARFSARNTLQGVVSRLHPGAVNTEVVLDLGGGQSVAAIITNASAQAMQLAEGKAASAIFKASSVILAVPA